KTAQPCSVESRDFTEHGCAVFDMQNYIEGHHRIERVRCQRQFGIEVMLTELDQSVETGCREAIASCIQGAPTHVDPYAVAARMFENKLQRSTRTATQVK